MALTEVNSLGIKDGEIKDADVNASAAIAGSKLAAATTSAAGSMSGADKTKLDGIAAGAEVNVQSDWNSTSGDNEILNKPTIPAAQVQSDWNATSGLGEILNKPTVPTVTGSTNNTITTVTAANAIQGEANLTFDGSALNATAGAASVTIKSTNANTAGQLHFDGDAVTTADYWLGNINGKWNGNDVAAIRLEAGDDTTNKDDGRITFHTSDASSTPDERMRIKPTGEVAIGGTGYAGQPFSVQTSGVNVGWMESTGTTRAVMNFSDANSTVGVGVGAIGNNHVFLKDSTEKLRIQSGGGISFNGDTASANALSDYEEGTFTPAYGGGVDAGYSHSNQNGAYVKIGKMVYWEVYLNGSGSTNSNQLYITGFPFAVANENSRGGAQAIWYQWPDGYGLYHGASPDRLWFYDGDSTVSGNTALAPGDAAHIKGSYRVG